MRTLKQCVASTMGCLLFACAGVASAADTVVLIISHEVADFGEWKKRFDGGKANREKAGLKERYVMRDAQKPNAVIVVMEIGSIEQAKKFISDPEFKGRIAKASSTGSADIKIGTTNPSGK